MITWSGTWYRNEPLGTENPSGQIMNKIMNKMKKAGIS
jgi:hypothetical protein